MRASRAILLPHRLPGPPVEAVLIERENRFLARCRIADGAIVEGAISGGAVVHAHVPDRGRLAELLVPGTRVWLYPAAGPARRTSWSLLVAEDPAAHVLTAIDPAGANARVRLLLDRGLVPGVGTGWDIRAEVPLGASRIDFVLTRGAERLALEVKSVGVVRRGTALFPDAPTTRGVKHLLELEAFARHGRGRRNDRAMVLFVAQRGDARRVRPDAAIDPLFAETLRRVAPRVDLRAIRLEVRPEGCLFLGAIPVRLA